MSTEGTLTFLVRQGRQPRLTRDMPQKAIKPTLSHIKGFSVQTSVGWTMQCPNENETRAKNPESVAVRGRGPKSTSHSLA